VQIGVAGFGQVNLDRQQLLIASAIALAVFVVAAAALAGCSRAGCCAR
jgi:hypothetical protein